MSLHVLRILELQVYLGHFTSGYVSFRYYLHNATAPNSTTPVLNYGANNNVLAVLVDALTEQEGWCGRA